MHPSVMCSSLVVKCLPAYVSHGSVCHADETADMTDLVPIV